MWIINRDSKRPEVFVLDGPEYKSTTPDPTEWIRSAAVGLSLKALGSKLQVLFDGDAAPTTIPK